MTRAVVPLHPGLFSAFGLLAADIEAPSGPDLLPGLPHRRPGTAQPTHGPHAGRGDPAPGGRGVLFQRHPDPAQGRPALFRPVLRAVPPRPRGSPGRRRHPPPGAGLRPGAPQDLWPSGPSGRVLYAGQPPPDRQGGPAPQPAGGCGARRQPPRPLPPQGLLRPRPRVDGVPAAGQDRFEEPPPGPSADRRIRHHHRGPSRLGGPGRRLREPVAASGRALQGREPAGDPCHEPSKRFRNRPHHPGPDPKLSQQRRRRNGQHRDPDGLLHGDSRLHGLFHGPVRPRGPDDLPGSHHPLPVGLHSLCPGVHFEQVPGPGPPGGRVHHERSLRRRHSPARYLHLPAHLPSDSLVGFSAVVAHHLDVGGRGAGQRRLRQHRDLPGRTAPASAEALRGGPPLGKHLSDPGEERPGPGDDAGRHPGQAIGLQDRRKGLAQAGGALRAGGPGPLLRRAAGPDRESGAGRDPFLAGRGVCLRGLPGQRWGGRGHHPAQGEAARAGGLPGNRLYREQPPGQGRHQLALPPSPSPAAATRCAP